MVRQVIVAEMLDCAINACDSNSHSRIDSRRSGFSSLNRARRDSSSLGSLPNSVVGVAFSSTPGAASRAESRAVSTANSVTSPVTCSLPLASAGITRNIVRARNTCRHRRAPRRAAQKPRPSEVPIDPLQKAGHCFSSRRFLRTRPPRTNSYTMPSCRRVTML